MTRFIAAAGLAAALDPRHRGRIAPDRLEEHARGGRAIDGRQVASTSPNGGAVPAAAPRLAGWVAIGSPSGPMQARRSLSRPRAWPCPNPTRTTSYSSTPTPAPRGVATCRLEQPTVTKGFCLAGDVGRLLVSLSPSGRSLRLEAIKDDCHSRAGLLTGTWLQENCNDKTDNCLGRPGRRHLSVAVHHPAVDHWHVMAAGLRWRSRIASRMVGRTRRIGPRSSSSCRRPTTTPLPISPTAASTSSPIPPSPQQDLACSASEQGVGRSVGELIASIKKQKSLLSGDPTPIVIDGHQGQCHRPVALADVERNPARDMNGVCTQRSSREAGRHEWLAIGGMTRRRSGDRLILLDSGRRRRRRCDHHRRLQATRASMTW